ncbi:histone-lysine N-methyltransferase SETMAR [Trichonephila clavipes]|nr:histone-lysine N-methyltransferase SETMAR [Trichonephila clavipes]
MDSPCSHRERNLCRRIDVCDSLLKRHENDPILKRIITGDEKGHGAKKMNRLQPFPKPIFTKKKLDKPNDALHQKRSELINRKGVVFHQDNARPHTSLVTRQKLLQLEWDTIPNPLYSSDLAPSDYYLFQSLQNFLDCETFTSNEEVKTHLDQFIASKDQKCYEWNYATTRKMAKGVGPERPIYNLIKECVTGLRVFSLTCPLGSLGPELMATLSQPNARSEVWKKDAN